MEVPNNLWIQIDYEQDAVIANVVHQVNEIHDYEIEEPLELASDILKRLHELGYYIKRCGVEIKEV